MFDKAAWRTRAELPTDVDDVRAVTLAAFDRTEEADLLDALRRDPAWLDGLSQVATTEAGTVVAHAVLTRCHIDDVAALCLGPCSVVPEHQRSGAGTAVINAALDAASAQGEAYVTLVGHPS